MADKGEKYTKGFTPPKQEQEKQPGVEKEMIPQPDDRMENYTAGEKLKGKKAVITGADSGIGRAVAIGFAKEGADVAVIYLDQDDDAKVTKECVEKAGRECLLVKGNLKRESFCKKAVEKSVKQFGRIDILVNNAAVQYAVKDFTELTTEQFDHTFKTNIYAYFFMIKYAIGHMSEGGRIINTTSVVAYQGHPTLIDYASTKGAVVGLTRALGLSLAEKKILVNGVAPGPIWTPLIPASFSEEKVGKFGSNTALKRPGQPDEIAPSYIFLASDENSYMTGQILHPNGGRIVNA